LFLVPADKDVYGRVVGVAIAADGSLLVSDDGANVIWRISYQAESLERSAHDPTASCRLGYIAAVILPDFCLLAQS
jgi:hypothetical protein